MDGFWHKNDNILSGKTKEESQFIDNQKEELANKHNIKVIRINCEISDLEYIKNNIMQSELSNIFKFKENNIDWLKCHEYACSSLVKMACDLWNKGTYDTLLIAKNIGISRKTIIDYLKKGAKIGMCTYNPKETSKENAKRQGRKNNTKIICVTTNQIFNSSQDAAKTYNMSPGHIGSCCKGNRNFAGKHPITGEKLVWMHYKEWEIQQNVNPII
jgi:hypothetical protein